MHAIFLAVRTYPFWAIPLGVIFWQIGVHFMHRRSKLRYSFWGGAGIVFLSVVAWIVFRGDKNAESWVRTFFML